MNRKTKLFLRMFAASFSLRIKYVGGLSSKVAGFLILNKGSGTIVDKCQ
jgi:hypothetical protein